MKMTCNLRGADLRGADLRDAYLAGADLAGAYLRGANFAGANLADTVLAGACPRSAYTALLMAGFAPAIDGYVYGWRTRRSVTVGDTTYTPGIHEAPVWSTCPVTTCHPGIYMLASREQAERIDADVVRCRARVTDVHVVSRAKGARCRAIEVSPALISPR